MIFSPWGLQVRFVRILFCFHLFSQSGTENSGGWERWTPTAEKHRPRPTVHSPGWWLTGERVLILLLAVSGSAHEASVGEVEGGWIYPPAP